MAVHALGSGTDIQTGPDGNLYVVSLRTAANLAEGAVYMISRVAPSRFLYGRESGP